jgi:anti-sigma factor RsiW
VPEVERLRRHLADPLLWEAPPEDLSHRVAAAISGRRAAMPGRRPARLRPAAAVAGLAVVVAGLAIGVRIGGAPDWRVVLSPTEEAPAAAATVAGWNTAEGTRMVIEVGGLPGLEAGEYYEVWLTAPDGRHVSAGSFRASGTVTVWAGVRRSEFPRIWVTLEPADQDPAPSGVTVLDASA